MALSGQQYQQLTNALTKAFPTVPDLTKMVRFGMDESLAEIAGGGNLIDISFNLIEWAEARGETDNLVVAARNQNPGNPTLREFAEQINVAAQTDLADSPLAGNLERIVEKSFKFANVEEWRSSFSKAELAVCRVEIPLTNGLGTGFLIGPSVVMTNYHVIKHVKTNEKAFPKLWTQIGVRFDYKTSVDGTTVQEGVSYRLAPEWLIDYSIEEELDYALLRLDGAPGNESVGGQMGAPTRGWLSPNVHKFIPNEPLFIIQHPKATPIKLAAGSLINETGHYITYNVSTEEGSSGSPCFSSDWNLVALHHKGSRFEGNEGIIMSDILSQAKVQQVLGT